MLLEIKSAVYGAELDGRFTDKRELVRHILAHEDLAAHRRLLRHERRGDIAAPDVLGDGARDIFAPEHRN